MAPGQEAASGLAGEGGLELFFMKGPWGLGLRGGIHFDAVGDAGYHGWLLEPTLYWAPLEGLTFYGTPGWVFSGAMTWKDDAGDHSEDAMAVRLLGGVRLKLFTLGALNYMLAAEGTLTRSLESENGHAYSGAGVVVSGLLSF